LIVPLLDIAVISPLIRPPTDRAAQEAFGGP